MSSYPRRRRRPDSSSRRAKQAGLVPIDPARRIARDTVLAGVAVSIVAAMLIALIWIMTVRTIDDYRVTIRERVEQPLAVQAATLAEKIRLELLPADQNLAILQAAWRKDPAGFKLSDWHGQVPAMRLVPRHSGFDGLSKARFQLGQVIVLHQDSDAPGRSWLA